MPPDPDDDDGKLTQQDTQRLDTLDASGNFLQVRSRGDVHVKGFWHRYVHIWIMDVERSRVLMQHRAPAKKIFGGMWNCCTGHVGEGDPSLYTAAKSLSEGFKLVYPESHFDFLFSCKSIAESDGLKLMQMIDVYLLPLATAPPTSALAVDCEEADALKYVTIDELEEIFRDKPQDHVVVSNPDYPRRLIYYLRKRVKKYFVELVQEDSDDERHNKKASQLLDTLKEDGSLADPGRRGEVHRQSVWHRAVHVWLLDLTSGSVLLQQRSWKKRHFAGQWNCSTGHVKMGEPSLPSAIKSIKDDLGLTLFADDEFEFLFQAKNESDTGGGCLLRQVLDVFCLSVPSSRSYSKTPPLEMMQLAKGEVDAVRYVSLDELEQSWALGKALHPDLVIPSADEYSRRLFYLLRQRCRQYHRELAGGGPSNA